MWIVVDSTTYDPTVNQYETYEEALEDYQQTMVWDNETIYIAEVKEFKKRKEEQP